MDVGVNEQFKSLMREDLSRRNAKEIQEAMRQSLSDIKIDLSFTHKLANFYNIYSFP